MKTKNLLRRARYLLSATLIALPLAGVPAHAATPAAIPPMERGKYLVEGIVACANCHAARDAKGAPIPGKGMSGGMVFEDAGFRVVAPNITPDPETGIGKWTAAQLARSIREGVRPDGSLVRPPMPIHFYRGISDSDLAAIVAYVRAQPAVKNAITEKPQYRIPLPPNYGPPVGRVSEPRIAQNARYGAYLATIGHCMECHTPRGPKGELLMGKVGAGGQIFPGPWGKSVARNLTPHASGLAKWSDAEINRAIRDGVSKDGSPLRPPMAFDWYKNISDPDMKALIAYLRSLKAQVFAGG